MTAVLDSEFLAVMLAGAASVLYGGSTRRDLFAFLKNMLTAVNVTAAGRLLWWARQRRQLVGLATRVTGALVCSGMSPNGGTLLDIPFIAQIKWPRAMILLDGTGIVGDLDRIELDASSAAALQFDGVPANSSSDRRLPTAKNLVCSGRRTRRR